MSIYKENGFKNRNDYLDFLAEDYGVSAYQVHYLASLLGESEDFDGLISTIQDLSEGYF